MPVASTDKKDKCPMDLEYDCQPKHTQFPTYPTQPQSQNQKVQQPVNSLMHKQASGLELKQEMKTVTIFDWDDTLLASSFLNTKGYKLDDNMVRCPEVDAQLKMLEASVRSVLSLALKYGEVHVITNAETGWVQLSAQKFIPGVVPILEKVTILSARSTYERVYPESPLKWKYHAFRQRLGGLFNCDHNKNVISFGDSHVEREAVRAVTRGQSKIKTKSVKFAERPSMEQLRRQLELVSNCFHYIYSHEGDLDLMLTISLCS